jgi:hypothetical protein
MDSSYPRTLNKPDGWYREQEFKRFGERIKWRVNNQWAEYEALTFSVEAPEGHLPGAPGIYLLKVLVGSGGLAGFGWAGFWVFVARLFSRAETCRV